MSRRRTGGPAYERVCSALEAADSAWQTGQDWTCPAHDDERASLGVTEKGDGLVLLHCQRGCSAEAVVQAIGMTLADLFPDELRDHAPEYRKTATYQYTDEVGEPLFSVIRRECRAFGGELCPEHPKRISQKPHGGGSGPGSMTGVRRVLYRLPEVIEAVAAGESVYVVEGEKDAELLVTGEGVCATTSPGGAGKWRDEYAEFLGGADVVVIADRDPGGYTHARAVHDSSVRAGAASVSLRLPVPTHRKADYTDHAKAGYGTDSLVPVEPDDLVWPVEDAGEATGDKFEQDVAKLAADMVRRELAKERAAEEVARIRAERRGLQVREPVDGATFILDALPDPEPVWGEGQSVLWAKGEALLIVGPQGVGKSTTAQQLALCRIGLHESELHDFAVASDDRRTVYLAMDRPAQIARSFRRMVDEDDRSVLKERLALWSGPLPVCVLAGHSALADWLADTFGSDVGTVIVDSYKDLAPGLSDDAVGAALNSAMQEVLARGVEWLGLHHQRRASNGNSRPERLEDVYGSVWLTAGTGSVLGLFGEPGSPSVEGTHLKQPASPVGPLYIRHDHSAGNSQAVDPESQVIAMLIAAGEAGVEVRGAAWELFGSSDKNAQGRALRLLRRVGPRLGAVTETKGKRGGVGGGGVPPRFAVRIES